MNNIIIYNNIITIQSEMYCSEEHDGLVTQFEWVILEHRKKVIIIITIFINCNWVVPRWQWLFCMHTKHEIGY